MTTKGYIVTGTDTGMGKTVFASMLTLALKGTYWKPLQSGTKDGTDSQTARKLTGLSDEHFAAEAYVLSQPLSPHRAAELDNISIAIQKLKPPVSGSPLIIEGAGGLMVPITRDVLFIDLFKQWAMPVILCARTALGTINHTLLSVEALKKRSIPIHGVAFIGDDNPDNISTIAAFSGAKILGRLPSLERVEKSMLEKAFAENFERTDFIHA
jgi:dethiobiotin synthetase